MINAVIRSMIGSWGNVLLDQYIANGLWINTLILLYALLVSISRRNYDNNLKSLIISLQEQYGQQIAKKGAGSILEKLKNSPIAWDEAIKPSVIPFLTPPGSFRLYQNNAQNFERFVSLEKLAEQLQQVS